MDERTRLMRETGRRKVRPASGRAFPTRSSRSNRRRAAADVLDSSRATSLAARGIPPREGAPRRDAPRRRPRARPVHPLHPRPYSVRASRRRVPSPIVPSEARGRRGPELARRLRRARTYPLPARRPRPRRHPRRHPRRVPSLPPRDSRASRRGGPTAPRRRRDVARERTAPRGGETSRGPRRRSRPSPRGRRRRGRGRSTGDDTRAETREPQKYRVRHIERSIERSTSREGVGLAVRRVGRSGGGDGAAGPAGVRAGRNPRGVVGGDGGARHRAHRTRAPVRYGGRAWTRVGL